MELLGYGILVFGTYYLWMFFTDANQRQVIFGYLLLLAVIAYIVGLVTGQGLDNHIGPY